MMIILFVMTYGIANDSEQWTFNYCLDRNTETSVSLNLSPFGTTKIPYSNGSAPTAATESGANNYAAVFSGHTLQKIDVQNTYTNLSAYLLTLAGQLTTAVYNKEVKLFC